MERKELLHLLAQVAAGETSTGAAFEALCRGPFLDYAAQAEGGVCLDHHRRLRTGLGEVVFGPGKSPRQLVECVKRLAQGGGHALASKLTPEQGELLQSELDGTFYEAARLFTYGMDLRLDEDAPMAGECIVVTAGASDRPIGLEAFGAARYFGVDCGFIPDIGVAGLHRVGPHLKALAEAKVLVVVAGMEGALPSVLGGMVAAPIIGVPTSNGYGANFGGVSALLSMLTSCSPGTTVVNIDNGFGAAASAARMLGMMERKG